MPSPLPHRTVAVTALLLVMYISTTVHAQTALKNGDAFEGTKYTAPITYDANAKLKDEKAFSSTILWKDCTASSRVTVQGTFDTGKTFATSVYFKFEKTKFSGEGQIFFNDLPPNSYVHAVGSTATGAKVNTFDIRPTTESNNITTLIDDSTIQFDEDVPDLLFVDLAVPDSSPYIVTHLRNAKLTNGYSIFKTTTCTKGSTIFLEKITCTKFRYDLILLTKISSISEESAIILKEIDIIDHTRPTRDGLLRTGSAVKIDASSVLAVIDIDLTNNFKTATPLRLFFKTQLSGAGSIVLLRIKMQTSGLLEGPIPDDNTHFWVVAKQSDAREMTTAELKAVNFSVNTNNVIHWDGTGANGKCVEAGLALPNTATYELVKGKCEATCPQGNYLPPACTPRAVCTGVPNCQACYAHPKTLCLECLPHTTAINGDTACQCPIRECINCPTANLCTVCSEGFKYSAEHNSCFHCTIDGCSVCSEDDKCSTCEAKYTLYNNQCIACDIENCDSCREAGKCFKCEAKYTLYNNQCIACDIDNCGSCREAGKCSECIADHKVTSDKKKCLHCTIPGCKECSADGVCKDCDAGYYFLESTSTPTKNKCVRCAIDVTNCDKCETDGICSECSIDHKPANEGKNCFHCTIPLCDVCRADGVCGVCDAGYSLFENQCVRCSADVPNCDKCKIAGICYECKAGYKPANGGTDCFQCSMPGCKECSADGVCKDCDAGYYFLESTSTPTDNKCVRCAIDVTNCDKCETDGICSECSIDHKPANEGKNCFHCTIPLCDVCRADRVCGACNAGYSLFENQCVRCSADVPKCDKCKTDGICSECIADHKPANGGMDCFHCTTPFCKECRTDGVCGACDDGYSLVESEDTPTDNKCVRCSIDVPDCLACKVDGICFQCLDDGYTLSADGRRCTLCHVDDCQRCDVPNVCSLCDAGMSVNQSGGCTPCDIGNCTYCSGDNTCGLCSCDMVPSDDGKKCVSCSAANCKYCNPSDGESTCAECMDGYEASSSGVCNKIILPQWVVFLIVVAATLLLMAAAVLAYMLYLRRLARIAQEAADAEERRRNRRVPGKSKRSRMEIAILDLGDIEDAASGVRDNQRDGFKV